MEKQNKQEVKSHSLTSEFIPYEQALELKELGFDEPCYDNYNIYGKLWGLRLNKQVKIKGACLAPTFSQAFRFFRDEKLSDSCVCRYQSRDDGGIYYYYVINHDFGIKETKHFKEGFSSYEEAELACIKKLIEIVKSNTNKL